MTAAAQPGAASSSIRSAPTDAKKLSLHDLRGVAALFVLLYHASFYLHRLRGDDGPLAIFSGFFGGYGVAVFFALSGYLMAEVAPRDSPGRFLVARITRIYPLFLTMVALFSALFLLIGQRRGAQPLELSLIPSGPRPYFLAVEWTLLYEMAYYVMLSALGFVGLARARTAIVAIWTAALFLAYALRWSDPNAAPMVLGEMALSVVNIPFGLGYLAAHAHRRGWLPPGLALLGAALAAVDYLAPDRWFRLLAGVSAALVVAGLVRAPDVPRGRWLAALGGRFGDASYALYLCHVPTILILHELIGAATPTRLVWAIWIAAALGLSLLLGPLDVASHRWIKAALARARPARVTGFALAYIAVFLSVAAAMEIDQRRRAARLRRATALVATTPSAAPPGSVRTGVEGVEKRPDGSWSIGGYGVDLDHPDLNAHFAILDAGRVVDIAVARRFRPVLAKEMGRPDLARRRIGFRLEAPAGYRCGAGGLEAALILDDGRVYRASGPELAAICR